MKTGIFSITSTIHDVDRIEQNSKAFIDSIQAQVDHELIRYGDDFSDYGDAELPLIFVRTGGTEGKFKELYPTLKAPFFLLTSGTDNSLAASMEILSFLRQNNQPAEIIHGDIAYISERIMAIARVNNALRSFCGINLGVVGKPSDWLISSGVDYTVLKEKLGVNMIDISIEEFMEEIRRKEYPQGIKETICQNYHPETLEVALHIYGALDRLIQKYKLSGLTVRCFDLLGTIHNTSCLALALLNSRGVVGTCEGDIPALLSMMILKMLVDKAGFQANPSRIDTTRNEMIFAHCTIPFNMVESYTYDSHFESGLGVAIKGIMPVGKATIFKTAGNLERYFVSDAEILNNLSSSSLCRTQITIKPEKSVQYFLTESIGNHHVIVNGHYTSLIDEFFKELKSFSFNHG